MRQGSRFVFAGGGSGGHLLPGIAVATELVQRDPLARVCFLGSEREIEKSIVVSSGFEHVPLPAESSAAWRRRPVQFAWNNGLAYRAAKRWLEDVRPSVVIGLGGFASVPAVLAAYWLRIPVVLLEQNTIPGRATRWLSRGASVTCVSFVETIRHLKWASTAVVTGNPVRREIGCMTTGSSRRGLSARPTVLVLGGSQGASALNNAVPAALRRLRNEIPDLWVVHQTGNQESDNIRCAYADSGIEARVQAFFDDLPDWYGQTSIAISRAGATTLAELACAGIPSILVPYPYAAANHQWHNAHFYEHAGGAVTVEQTADPGDLESGLVSELRALLNDPDRLELMNQAMRSEAKPKAARVVADHIEALMNLDDANPTARNEADFASAPFVSEQPRS